MQQCGINCKGKQVKPTGSNRQEGPHQQDGHINKMATSTRWPHHINKIATAAEEAASEGIVDKLFQTTSILSLAEEDLVKVSRCVMRTGRYAKADEQLALI